MTHSITPLLIDLGDLLVAVKPSGYNSHSPDLGKKGFLEFVEDFKDKKLYTVHRLDKETSGLLLIAETSEAAKEMAEKFEKHQVTKHYLFLTDKEAPPSDRVYKSHIQKKGSDFVSTTAEESNSETHFSFVKKIGSHFLWRAFPKTGKPHQIRLHAEALGIPILGDQQHGGTAWPQMCLHAEHLEFEYRGLPQQFTAPTPTWAEVPLAPEEAALAKALDRRRYFYNWPDQQEQCLRLSHLDNDKYRIDQFGSVWFVYWYAEEDPSEKDLEMFSKWGQKSSKKVVIRKMLNRGADPTSQILWNLHQCPERWNAFENHLQFELRLDSGLSPGLFLDQRNNRNWVFNHSKNKSVLNLFSYTSGFSVAAAMGQAAEVVTVDVSANFLDWSKTNFTLNQLDPEKYEFWNNDVLLFLKGTHRRKRKFDLIVCDPPSFGRSKEGVFTLAKQWEALLTSCLLVLNKGGLILFSNNYEQWDLPTMRKSIERLSREIPIEITNAPPTGWDYETPDEEALMKSLIIRKK